MPKLRSELRIDLRDELKTDPNGRIWQNRELDEFMAQAYMAIQADFLFDLPENESTTATLSLIAGTSEYALQSNFGKLENIQLSNKSNLRETTLAQVYASGKRGESGTPNSFYFKGDYIGVHPEPIVNDTAYMLYKAKHVFPTADSSAIAYNDDFARMIVKYSAYLAWSAPRGNRDTARAKYEDYKILKTSYATAYQYRSAEIKFVSQRSVGGVASAKGLNF